MNGNRFSNNREDGQVLLIIVMLLATVITIVTTVSFKSTTDTQLTKLEQESQKTLAAAEAGIEKAIGDNLDNNTYQYSDIDLENLGGIDLTESQVVVTKAQNTTFVSPIQQKDQQYTFYLADYNAGVFSNPYAGNITLYYGSDSACSSVALEIALISGSAAPYTIKRYIADTSNQLASNTDNIGRTGVTTIEDTRFNCKTDQITIPANARLMIARALFSKTRLGMQGSTILRPQGKVITSEAKSQSGVVKKVELFQSLPQIPTEFFVTAF